MPTSIVNGITVWTNYTYSNCATNLTAHGNVVILNTTLANMTGSGLLCSAAVNIGFFWPAFIITCYVICFFLFGAYLQSMRMLLVTAAIMFVLCTVLSFEGFIGTTMWAASLALMVISAIRMYMTSK